MMVRLVRWNHFWNVIESFGKKKKKKIQGNKRNNKNKNKNNAQASNS